MGCCPPGSSVHEILQARILEELPCPPPGNLSNPGTKPMSLMSLAQAGRFFTLLSKSLAWIQAPIFLQTPQMTPRIPLYVFQFSSVASDSLQPQGLQHTGPPCPSPTPGVYSNSCPSSRWCHSTISSSVVPFLSRLQSFPASGSFQMRQVFASGGQSVGVSASTWVLPMNTQDWSPLGWTGWISLQSKGLLRVFSNTTIQKHQFFGAQLSL